MKYFRGKGRRYGRRMRRGRAAVKYWKKTVPRPIRKYVKAIVHRQIENKEKILYAANQTITCGDANTMTYPLLPPITQGITDDKRIGNVIKCVKGQLKMTLNLKPYNSTTNPYAAPFWVKIWVVKDLRFSLQIATMDSVPFSNFFRGNGTALGFQCNPLDLTLPVNESIFRVLYTKTFKLGNSNHISGATNPSSYFDNSPFAKQISINYAKWAKGQIKFNETSDYCTNKNLYVVIQCVPCDGTSGAGKDQLEYHYTNTFTFEDA